MKINRIELLQRLDAVQPGLSAKENTEQSSCFAFQDGWVMTFNDQIACKAPSKFPPEFIGAVKADPLLKQLREWSDDEIDVTWNESRLIIKGTNKETKIRLFAEVLLEVDRVDIPTEWYALDPEFSEAVSIVQQCAAKDESQGYITTCVHLHPDWIEAFDNNQMTRYTIQAGFAEPIVVRKDDLKHVLPLDMTEFADTNSWVHFRNPADITISCRKAMDEFVNIDDFPVFEGDPLTLPKGIASAAKRAAVFSSENKDNDQVKVELLPNPGRIRISSIGESGEFSERLPAKYEGQPRMFFIRPRLLEEIVTRHTECLITEDRLKVEGGKWVYASSLGDAEDTGA